jgi:hypothetical protein
MYLLTDLPEDILVSVLIFNIGTTLNDSNMKLLSNLVSINSKFINIVKKYLLNIECIIINKYFLKYNLINLIKNKLNLKIISFYDCPLDIDKHSVLNCIDNCLNIKLLEFNLVNFIDDNFISVVITKFKKLEQLSIRDSCANITFSSLDNIVINCKNIKFLNLKYNTLTNYDLSKFKKDNPSIKLYY